VSNLAESSEQHVLKVCATHALEARAALKRASTIFQQLPRQQTLGEQEMYQIVATALKRAAAEVFAILCSSSLAVDSRVPQVPARH
jgi:hypothetical protein